MFGDDTSFDRTFKCVNGIQESFIQALFKICKWLNFNKCSLDVAKTEFMITGTPNSISKLNQDPRSTLYMIVATDDCGIIRVKLVKSLCLIVDETLTWSIYIECISVKVKQGIVVIKRISRYLDKNSLLML